MSMLHSHHIEYRSKSGSKTNAPSNQTTLCTFHHGLVHVGIIKTKGQAAHELDWQTPALLDEVMTRMERRRKVLALGGTEGPNTEEVTDGFVLSPVADFQLQALAVPAGAMG